MPKIIDVQTVFPKNEYSQSEIVNHLLTVWPDFEQKLKKFHENVQVDKRALAMELEQYSELKDFGERCDIWKKVSKNLLKESLEKIFHRSKLGPSDIHLIASNSVTGISIPSIEALLMNEFDFSPGTKRLPLFGLGCLAGVAGINRVQDYLKAYPSEAALFLSSELCSLTFQFDDKSVANLISTGLFADGAGAVLMVGDDHPLAHQSGLKILDTQSFFYPDTERTMGWDIRETGFKIVLSGSVPEIVRKNIPGNVSTFLSASKRTPRDLGFFLAHPGGPKVLKTVEECLCLKDQELRRSWESLREHGNLSSVSVLNIMQRFFKEQESENSSLKSDMGLMMAMGPAFCSEMTSVRWEF